MWPPSKEQIDSLKGEFLDNQTKFLTAEWSRLKVVEQEYKMLLTLIEVMGERDPVSDEVCVKISRSAQMEGKTWREICEIARAQNT